MTSCGCLIRLYGVIQNIVFTGHILNEMCLVISCTIATGLDAVLQDMIGKSTRNSFPIYESAMHELNHSNPNHTVADLISRDVQRCRDHGFPDYNTARQVVTKPKLQNVDAGKLHVPSSYNGLLLTQSIPWC